MSRACRPRQRRDIRQQLAAIDTRLTQIELAQQGRVPVEDIRESMRDVLKTLGLVGQLREVYSSQKEQMAIMVGWAAQMLTEARTVALASTAAGVLTDTQAVTDAQATTDSSQDIITLLMQLVEDGGKHIAQMDALKQAIEGTRHAE